MSKVHKPTLDLQGFTFICLTASCLFVHLFAISGGGICPLVFFYEKKLLVGVIKAAAIPDSVPVGIGQNEMTR